MLYVMFDDSQDDPTYNVISEAFIVIPKNDYISFDNPCSWDNIKQIVPVIPKNKDQAFLYAQMAGWEPHVIDGCVVLKTNIKASN